MYFRLLAYFLDPSFFCRITDYNHPLAAKTGVTETTMTPTKYDYLDNANITLWDCPGIGTANFRDVKSYCQKIKIEKYDAFIIMTSDRFSDKAGDLAKVLKSINKPFLFARTRIDQAYISQSVTMRGAFNEVEMLNDIKVYCSTNLKFKEVPLDDKDIFLISSLFPYKWDFARLTEAIKNRLHYLKRECFLFSMLTLSESILKAKVDLLKGINCMYRLSYEGEVHQFYRLMDDILFCPFGQNVISLRER